MTANVQMSLNFFFKSIQIHFVILNGMGDFCIKLEQFFSVMKFGIVGSNYALLLEKCINNLLQKECCAVSLNLLWWWWLAFFIL